MITYSVYNLTSTSVVVDDVPITLTAAAYTTTAFNAGNTQSDILGSILLRDHVLEGRLSLLVNGKPIDYNAILRSQGNDAGERT